MKILAALITATFGMAFGMAAEARDLTSGLATLDCFNNSFRQATLKTSSDALQVTDTFWIKTNEDVKNLAALIGMEKAEMVSGFRYTGPAIRENCKFLTKENSIFYCDLQWVSVELLTKDGSTVDTVPNGFISMDASLKGLRASLTVVTDKNSAVWKLLI